MYVCVCLVFLTRLWDVSFETLCTVGLTELDLANSTSGLEITGCRKQKKKKKQHGSETGFCFRKAKSQKAPLRISRTRVWVQVQMEAIQGQSRPNHLQLRTPGANGELPSVIFQPKKCSPSKTQPLLQTCLELLGQIVGEPPRNDPKKQFVKPLLPQHLPLPSFGTYYFANIRT